MVDVLVETEEVDVHVNDDIAVEDDDVVVEDELVIAVVVLGVVLEVVVELGVVVSEVVTEGVEVEDVDVVVWVEVGVDVVDGEELLERARYAAAPATATTTIITTARTIVAMPLDELCK